MNIDNPGDRKSKSTWEKLYAPDKHPSIKEAYKPLEGHDIRKQEILDDKRSVRGFGRRILTIMRGEVTGDVTRTANETLAFTSHLQRMRDEWGINTVKPVFSIGSDNLYAITNEIANPGHFQEYIDARDSKHLASYAKLSVRASRMLADTVAEEGTVYPNTYSLEQYVIARQSDSEEPILVDIEPIGFELADENEHVANIGKDSLDRTIRYMAQDIIQIRLALGDSNEDSTIAVASLLRTCDVAVSAGLLDKEKAELIRDAIETNDSESIDPDEDEEWQ